MSDSDEPVIVYTPKLLSRSMEQSRKRLHSSNITANQRAMKVGNEDFFAEDGKLFCRVCCKVVDHTRQGSLDRHKLTEGDFQKCRIFHFYSTWNELLNPNRKVQTIKQNIRLKRNWEAD